MLDVALGAGDDRFWGGDASEKVDAGPGDDEVNGGGGIDYLDCGGGSDVRWVGDYTQPNTVAVGCEQSSPGFGPVDESAVRALLDQLLVDTSAPGVQLGVRVPGQPDVALASGVDNVLATPQTPMPTDGTFPIASVTKTFTSAVVLQLIEEGQLSFDDTLDTWLPDYPHAAAITVRQLLEHTSGMFSYGDSGNSPTAIFASPSHSFEELMALNATEPPHSAPPSEFHYSNANYWALGYIIEQVTGQDAGEVMRQRIFEPLGLDQTELDEGTASITQYGWVLPTLDFRQLPRVPFMTWYRTAGAGVSSTQDLLDWGEAIYGGHFLGPQIDAELHHPSQYRLGQDGAPDSWYGLGVGGFCPCPPNGTTQPVPTRLGHYGALPGTGVRLAHQVPTGITLVWRVNIHGYAVSEAADAAVTEDILELIAGDAAGLSDR